MTQWLCAIDPSLTGFCIAWMRPDSETVELKETSSKPQGTMVDARLRRYRGLIVPALNQIRERAPELVLIEGYAYGAKGSVIQLAEFGGVLRHGLASVSSRLVEVPPTVVKKFATGKGNAKKPEVASALARRWGMTFRTDNEADAFALAQIGAVLLGHRKPANAIEREIHEGVLEREKAAKAKGAARGKKTANGGAPALEDASEW